MTDIDPLLRKALKLLLFQLAAKYERPSERLEAVLKELIHELYLEAQQELSKKKQRFRLVVQ